MLVSYRLITSSPMLMPRSAASDPISCTQRSPSLVWPAGTDVCGVVRLRGQTFGVAKLGQFRCLYIGLSVPSMTFVPLVECHRLSEQPSCLEVLNSGREYRAHSHRSSAVVSVLRRRRARVLADGRVCHPSQKAPAEAVDHLHCRARA